MAAAVDVSRPIPIKRPRKVASWLAYVERELAKPEGLTPERRETLESKRQFFTDMLDKGQRCRCCGAELKDARSIKRHIGPCCWAKGARVAS